jgi:hypothetical protein
MRIGHRRVADNPAWTKGDRRLVRATIALVALQLAFGALTALAGSWMHQPSASGVFALAVWFGLPAFGLYRALPYDEVSAPAIVDPETPYRSQSSSAERPAPSLRGARVILWICVGLHGVVAAQMVLGVLLLMVAAMAVGGAGPVR